MATKNESMIDLRSRHVRRDAADRPIRVLRVIARLIGGPAYHVSLLAAGLEPARYETLLVHGGGGRHEDTLDEVVEHYPLRCEVVDALRPELRPDRDFLALRALMRIIRRYKPDIVHTHTAKAGVLGRVAARLVNGPPPLVIHTYHGHVLEGYFGRVASNAFRVTERGLARLSDRLIGVSEATVDDLVRLNVAPRDSFCVIPVGLDLARFASASSACGADFRREISAADREVVVTFAGRLVPIKRLDVLLDGFAHARNAGAPLRLALVGSGELRATLEDQVSSLALWDVVHFLEHRTDVEKILAGSDVAALTSDNEGTPVFLIEAAASSVPAVATDVGGVSEVIRPDMGILVPRGDSRAVGNGLVRLAARPELRSSMGARAKTQVLGRFSAARLLSDTAALYDDLLAERAAGLERSGI